MNLRIRQVEKKDDDHVREPLRCLILCGFTVDFKYNYL